MKINPSEHPKIWRKFRTGKVTQMELAEEYGVTQGAISRILLRDPNYVPPKRAGARRKELLELRGREPSEWPKRLQRAYEQSQIAQQGFETAICFAHRDGLSIRQIAAATGLSYGQVQYILERNSTVEGGEGAID